MASDVTLSKSVSAKKMKRRPMARMVLMDGGERAPREFLKVKGVT